MTEQTKTADRILWLDLETDGLDISRCQVLEVGCVLTKGFAEGLEVVGEFSSPVWPLFGEAALDEMPEQVREMHRASGLWDACLADDDLTPEVVGVRWLSWLIDQGAVNYTTTSGGLVVGGSGIDRFDVPIIERVFPVIAREFHWRRMDVSAMKLLVNELDRGDLLPKQTGQAHRALADAHWARQVALHMAALVEYGPWPQRVLLGFTDAARPGPAGPTTEALWTLDTLTTVDPPAWAVWRRGDEDQRVQHTNERCETTPQGVEFGTAYVHVLPPHLPAGMPTQADVLEWVRDRWPDRTEPIWRAAKLCEEAGEVIGAVIKSGEGRKTVDDVRQETAQVVICAMGLAEAVGFDLWQAVADDYTRSTKPAETVSFAESQARVEESLASSGTALEKWSTDVSTSKPERPEMAP